MGVEQAFSPFFFKGNWPQVFFPFCYVEINLQLTFTYRCHSGLWRAQPEASSVVLLSTQMCTRGQQSLWKADSSAPSHSWAPGMGRAQLCQHPLLPGKCSCATLVTTGAWWFKISKRNCPPLTLVDHVLTKIKIIKSTYCQISCVQFTPRPAGHKTSACPTQGISIQFQLFAIGLLLNMTQ